MWLCGCATVAGYKATVDTWLGSSESTLISSWGAPRNSYQMTNGSRALEYYSGANIPMGGYTWTTPQTTNYSGTINTMGDVNTYGSYSGTATQWVTTQTPIYNVQVWCKTTFIINPSGIIESWQAEGNNCVAVAPKKQKPIYETEMSNEDLKVQSEIIAKACQDGKILPNDPSCKQVLPAMKGILDSHNPKDIMKASDIPQ